MASHQHYNEAMLNETLFEDVLYIDFVLRKSKLLFLSMPLKFKDFN